MKKAFTLAEVLITLVTIGIVAMLIMPSFINNVNDQKIKSARKVVSQKLMSGFAQMKLDGALETKYSSTGEFVDAMKKYFNIARVCTKNELDQCFSSIVYSLDKTGNSIADLDGDIVGVKLVDGSSLLVKYNPDEDGYDVFAETQMQTFSDGKDKVVYPVFGNLFEYVFDTNEKTSPNIFGKDIIGNLPIVPAENGGNDAAPKTYTITFKNDDGTVLQTLTLAEGEMPSYSGNTPSKKGGYYMYQFTGWQPAITAVSGDATYTAKYIEYSCFMAGSKILMADGSTKNIEDVVVGDKVISYNIQTDKFYNTNVIKATKEYISQSYFEVKLDNGTILKPTINHPILTNDGFKTIMVWDKYKNLKIGDKVKTTSGYSEVVSIVEMKLNRRTEVYNLNVKDDDEEIDDDTLDNYVVDGIVAHNHSGGVHSGGSNN